MALIRALEAELVEAEAANTALREDNERLARQANTQILLQDELRAENAALRDALEDIGAWTATAEELEESKDPERYGYRKGWNEAAEYANRALLDKEGSK